MKALCRGCTHENMTAKKLNLIIMPHEEICESSIEGKQHQTNIPK